MDEREYKSFPTFVKAIEDRTVDMIFSVTGVIDLYRDRIKRGAFKKTLLERKDSIRILWQHDHFLPPIGVLLDAKEITRASLPPEIKEKFPEATGALEGRVEFLETDRGEEALIGIQKEAIRENSIGFDSIRQKTVEETVSDDVKITLREIQEIRLWDLSPVNWGANPATFNRTSLEFKSTGATRTGKWAEPTLLDFGIGDTWDEAEQDRVAQHYAMAEMPFNVFDDLSFPHHVAMLKGIGPAHWNGTASAMSDLLYAELTLDEKEGVHDHLAHHYRDEFEESPPNMKLFELADAVQSALAIDELDLRGVSEAVKELNTKLIEAGPRLAGMPTRTHFGREILKARALEHHVNSL